MFFEIKKLAASGVLTVAILLCSGCFSPDNNYLRPADFARELRKNGIVIEQIRPLDPRPLGATEALEMRVAGSGIGVYKFDRSNRNSREKLERISKSKKIYFNGIPYPIYEVCGSFFIVGLDKNTEKRKILEVLRNFK